MEPDAVEMRVLGCLIEKQRTTPDAYPLTLNSLRLACNQSTNRDPVVDYDERDIRGALERLGKRRWTRLASWGNSRVMKYRHLADETLGLSEAELSVLAVLMLRGPQTAAELRQRSERLYGFDEGELEQTLERLAGREFARRLERRPGERGQRWAQLLGGAEEEAPAATHAAAADADVPRENPSAGEAPSAAPSSRSGVGGAAADAEPSSTASGTDTASPSERAGAGPISGADPAPAGAAELARRVARLEDGLGPSRAEVDGRLEHLEREVAELRAELRELREQLGG